MHDCLQIWPVVLQQDVISTRESFPIAEKTSTEARFSVDSHQALADVSDIAPVPVPVFTAGRPTHCCAPRTLQPREDPFHSHLGLRLDAWQSCIRDTHALLRTTAMCHWHWQWGTRHVPTARCGARTPFPQHEQSLPYPSITTITHSMCCVAGRPLLHRGELTREVTSVASWVAFFKGVTVYRFVPTRCS